MCRYILCNYHGFSWVFSTLEFIFALLMNDWHFFFINSSLSLVLVEVSMFVLLGEWDESREDNNSSLIGSLLFFMQKINIFGCQFQLIVSCSFFLVFVLCGVLLNIFWFSRLADLIVLVTGFWLLHHRRCH